MTSSRCHGGSLDVVIAVATRGIPQLASSVVEGRSIFDQRASLRFRADDVEDRTNDIWAVTKAGFNDRREYAAKLERKSDDTPLNGASPTRPQRRAMRSQVRYMRMPADGDRRSRDTGTNTTQTEENERDGGEREREKERERGKEEGASERGEERRGGKRRGGEKGGGGGGGGIVKGGQNDC